MIKKFLVLLFSALLVNALPSSALAAFGHVGQTCVADSGGVSASSLTCTTTATVEAGNLHIIILSKDNAAATGGNTNECTTAQDSAGNTYSKIYEYTYAEGAANAGATTCAFYSIVTTQLSSGGTATVNFSDSRVGSAMIGREFTIGQSAITVLTANVQTEDMDGVDAGSLAISGLASAERLYLRAIGYERSGASITPTTNFTSFGATRYDAGTDNTSMAIVGEFRINTSTGETSDPTTNAVATGDGGNFFIPLVEGRRRPISPIFFQ